MYVLKNAGLNSEWNSNGYRSDVEGRAPPTGSRPCEDQFFLLNRILPHGDLAASSPLRTPPSPRRFRFFSSGSLAFSWATKAIALSIALLSAASARCAAFLRSQAAIDEVEYLGPEPDRWVPRPELTQPGAGTLYRSRARRRIGSVCPEPSGFEARSSLPAAPEKIGLQPWQTTEVWERLKAALREYRHLAAAGRTHAR